MLLVPFAEVWARGSGMGLLFCDLLTVEPLFGNWVSWCLGPGCVSLAGREWEREGRRIQRPGEGRQGSQPARQLEILKS